MLLMLCIFRWGALLYLTNKKSDRKTYEALA